MKICLTCKQEKDLSEFYKHSKNKNGYLSYCKICSNIDSAKRQALRRREALETMGGKCVECGFNDWRALQIDHVNGGGSQEFKKIGHRAAYKKAVKGDPNYQLLCANCNWIKRYENNEATGNTKSSV